MLPHCPLFELCTGKHCPDKTSPRLPQGSAGPPGTQGPAGTKVHLSIATSNLAEESGTLPDTGDGGRAVLPDVLRWRERHLLSGWVPSQIQPALRKSGDVAVIAVAAGSGWWD